jgi:hypothetical protein
MTQKPRNQTPLEGGGKQSPRDRETSSYEQHPGGTDSKGAPGSVRNPRQPHERDESARASGAGSKDDRPPSDRQITQAAEDVERGLVDTDRRGIPDDIPNSKST